MIFTQICNSQAQRPDSGECANETVVAEYNSENH